MSDTPEPKQLPGCLPEGYTLDSMLTFEQFCIWQGRSRHWLMERNYILPGAINIGDKLRRVHPRSYLEWNVEKPKPQRTETQNESPKQTPGCLPEGYSIDSILTPEQFCMWMQKSRIWLNRHRFVIPGYIMSEERFHPRTYLETRARRWARV